MSRTTDDLAVQTAPELVEPASTERRRHRPILPLLPARFRRTDPPTLIFELLLVGMSYWLYSVVRNGAPEQVTAAMRRAGSLLELEQALGIAVERGINRAVEGVTWLVVSMNYYYATMHFVVTIGVLVWLYRHHAPRYRAARSVLYATSAVGLIGFYVFPLAPPRFLPEHGFIDTIVKHNTWGSWASGDVAAMSNQYAAMPSMHVAWALWCGIAVFTLAERRWVRVAGAAYPFVTSVVIVATANHFVLDAVGGAAALGCGFAIQRVLAGRPVFGRPAPRNVATPVRTSSLA